MSRETVDIIRGKVKRDIYGSYDDYEEVSVRDLILTPEFAKAFFGEEYYYQDENQLFDDRKKWQYHLKQMVILDDPIKYLEPFLEKSK